MNFEFHPEAEQDLHESALYYEREVPWLGRRFADEVARVVDLLVERPDLGSYVDAE